MSKSKSLIPKKNSPDADRVYTPFELSVAIVKYFNPNCRVVEPSAGPIGKQSFVSAILNYSTARHLKWYELDEGSDFLAADPLQEHYTWPAFSMLPYYLIRFPVIAR